MTRITSVLRNSVWNVVALVVSMVSGLFYTPYLVARLGVSSYGMVPLITGLFTWVSWLSLAVSWSVGRFMTLAREQHDSEQENRYFNAALVPAVLLALVLAAIGVAMTPLVDRIVRVPAEASQAVGFLWICSGLIAATGVLAGAMDVGTYCRNRFDVKAAIQIARTVVMIVFVLLLFKLRGPRLEWVGLGTLFGSIVGLGLILLSLRVLIPEVRIRPAMFSKPHFREMLSTNAWILVDQLGTILLLNIDLFLANRFFGPEISGQYGLASQWVGMVKAVMTAMTVFTPAYVVFVARKDPNGLARYAVNASRYVGFAMAIPIGLVLGLAEPLTRAWLHGDPGLVPALIVALTVPLAFNAAINPLYGVWQALNKVRIPSYATLAAGIVGIALTVVLVRTTQLGVYAVAIAGGVAFTARNLLFTIWYVSRLLGQAGKSFVRVSLATALVSLLLGGAGRLLVFFMHPVGWSGVILAGLILGGLGCLVVWWGCLNRDERGRAIAIISLRIRGGSYERTRVG